MDAYELDSHWDSDTYAIRRVSDRHVVQEFGKMAVSPLMADAIVGLMNSAYRSGADDMRNRIREAQERAFNWDHTGRE